MLIKTYSPGTKSPHWKGDSVSFVRSTIAVSSVSWPPLGIASRAFTPRFEIAQDEKTDAKLIANLNDVLVGLGKKRELKQNHLSNAVVANDIFELIGPAEQWNPQILDLIVVGN